MIDAIIQWSLRNRLFVLVGAAALIAWGIVQAREMPVDVFPDLTAPKVTVITEAHGMAPEEVERLVTYHIEAAMNGASNVRRVRSSTSVGVSVVWVEFEWGTDIYRARQIVSEKLNLVQSALPADIPPPVLGPVSSIMGEILFIGLSSETVSGRELRTIADWDVRRRILSVAGVSQVIPIGGEVEQFQVLIHPSELASYKLSIDDVVEAVRETNENTSAGFYEESGQEFLIHGIGRVADTDDIGNTVIELRNGVPIRVRDVAEVVIGGGIKRGDASIMSTQGVVLGIQKQPDINTLALTERLDTILDDIESGLPAGVELHRSLLRQADFIDNGIENIVEALRDGSLLVILIVGLFLLSGRATLITALAIPLSLVVTVLVLHAMGASLNTMTLGGMAIAVGALVDDAIIDVENVVRRLRESQRRPEGRSLLEIVYQASAEIRGSIVFATMIIVLVFLPLFFLQGVEGRLLAPLGIAYVVSLTASLVVALTVTPVLCLLLLPKSRAVRKGIEPAPVRWMRRNYESSLDRVLPLWPVLVAVSVVAVIIAGFAATRAGRTFLPAFNEGALTISAVTLPGTSLDESNRIGKMVEDILLEQPEVVTTARRTGRAELDEHAQGVNASEIEVQLDMADRSEEEMLSALREQFDSIAGVNIVIGQPISHRIDHMISGTRANIAVKIFGPRLEELGRIASDVEAQMSNIPGVVDLAVEQQANLPFVTVEFNRDLITQYGLRIRDVSHSLETIFYGQVVSRVMRRPYAFDLVVRYPDSARKDLKTVRETMIPTPTGAWVPLEALAEIHRDRGPNKIGRENAQRKIVVMCNVGDGEALGDVVKTIQERIDSNIVLPRNYFIEYGGQFEATEDATRVLFVLGVAVLFGIMMLLYVALSSVRDALLVMLNLPLALIGGVVGVFASGGVISIASIIGFITLFGIATRNGIMMVTHIRYLQRREGVSDPREAVIRGASERLAPILMTALASGLGLLPLALAMGEPGSEIQAPMAVVILFGLISSTLLNMFVVPAVMLRFGSVRV